MRRILVLILAAVAVSGCETTDVSAQAEAKTMKRLPQFDTHMDCLALQARKYARADGSPLELGIIGSSNCNQTRIALHNAILKIESQSFADSYIHTARREEPKMIAAEIIRLRG